MSLNRASMIFGLASWILKALCNSINPFSLYWPPPWYTCRWQRRYHLKISVNSTSTISGLAFRTILGLWNSINPQSIYQLPIWVNMIVTTSCPTPTTDRPWRVNNFCEGSVSYTTMNCIASFLIWVLRSQSHQYILQYIFTNLHPMSHISDCFCF